MQMYLDPEQVSVGFANIRSVRGSNPQHCLPSNDENLSYGKPRLLGLYIFNCSVLWTPNWLVILTTISRLQSNIELPQWTKLLANINWFQTFHTTWLTALQYESMSRCFSIRCSALGIHTILLTCYRAINRWSSKVNYRTLGSLMRWKLDSSSIALAGWNIFFHFRSMFERCINELRSLPTLCAILLQINDTDDT